MRNFMKLSIYS